MRHRFFIFCWLTALTITGAPSQQSVKFAHLTVNDGLSQGSVICILQDRKGFMWFGTQVGLNRYDGYTTTVFKHDPSVANSLDNSFVIMLAEDSSGVLWVRTLAGTGMLNRYDPATESFTQVPEDSLELAGAAVSSARSHFVDASGTVDQLLGWGDALTDTRKRPSTSTIRKIPASSAITSIRLSRIAQAISGSARKRVSTSSIRRRKCSRTSDIRTKI
jgi:ligand-binding sensor domain-containing protein